MTSRPETSNSFETTWLDILLACETKEEQLALIATLTPAELEKTHADWECFARDDQLPPGFKRAGGRRAEYRNGEPDWSVWLVLGGRGAGKTRTGAEWVRGVVEGR